MMTDYIEDGRVALARIRGLAESQQIDLDTLNLAVAHQRVKTGMSEPYVRLYKQMAQLQANISAVEAQAATVKSYLNKLPAEEDK